MKTRDWTSCALGDVLEPNRNVVTVDPMKRYQQVTIKLWGRGVVPRGEIAGADIKGTARTKVRTGQFIISKIDARNGAMGIVPAELDGALASNDFPAFDVDARRLRPQFLGWLTRTPGFIALCKHASEGTTNRVRLSSERMLALKIQMPEPDEQDRIVETLDAAASRLADAQRLCQEIDEAKDALLRSAFHQITDGAPRVPMSEAAPLVRRPVDVKMGGEYRELGIRSFGNGTFHKPALDYLAVGDKKLYYIEPGDLLFNNVFAWEGAIAVAQPEDEGRVGSHRFITCLANHEVATADYLAFYFLTPEGMEAIGKASPGGAGRNRTLGLDKLMVIPVPVPSIEKQLWFGRLHAKLNEARVETRRVATETEALMPSILDRAFRGDL